MCTLKSEDSNEMEPSLSAKSSSLLSAHGQPFQLTEWPICKGKHAWGDSGQLPGLYRWNKTERYSPLQNILRGYLEPHKSVDEQDRECLCQLKAL